MLNSTQGPKCTMCVYIPLNRSAWVVNVKLSQKANAHSGYKGLMAQHKLSISHTKHHYPCFKEHDHKGCDLFLNQNLEIFQQNILHIKSETSLHLGHVFRCVLPLIGKLQHLWKFAPIEILAYFKFLKICVNITLKNKDQKCPGICKHNLLNQAKAFPLLRLDIFRLSCNLGKVIH